MDTLVEAAPVAEPVTPAYPEGEYAIVELFGHTTMVGRIAEVERFGAKMLAIKQVFRDALLAPVYCGGASIYRLTPCPAAVAWKQQPRGDWSLPPSVRACLPAALLSDESADNRHHHDNGDDEEPY